MGNIGVTLSEIRMIALSKVPYDKGYMYINGLRFSEDSTKYVITYDTNVVPYIWYQEKGFTHWKSGDEVTENKGFIHDRTINALTSYINEPTQWKRQVIDDDNEQTVQARRNKLSQGIIESLKGNENR